MANGLTIAQDMTETQQKGSFQFCQANSPQVFAQNDQGCVLLKLSGKTMKITYH